MPAYEAHSNALTTVAKDILYTWFNMPVEFHISETNRSCQARTWIGRLADGYAIKPPHNNV